MNIKDKNVLFTIEWGLLHPAMLMKSSLNGYKKHSSSATSRASFFRDIASRLSAKISAYSVKTTLFIVSLSLTRPTMTYNAYCVNALDATGSRRVCVRILTWFRKRDSCEHPQGELSRFPDFKFNPSFEASGRTRRVVLYQEITKSLSNA